jgi:BirA family biotin operon repressor/biotin-[acetyl-CoA-carboxylase] ligase
MSGNLVSATLRSGLFTRVVGKRLLFFQEITSTMDEAVRQAESGTVEGTVVVAERQTAGRGRHGRSWVSREGNLYFSAVFRPTMDTLPFLSMIAGVASSRAIRKITGLDPRIKWPNDVILDGKKVGGILVESAVEGEKVLYAIVGVGINVNLDTEKLEDIAGHATDLNTAAGRSVPREEVFRQLLHDLDSLYLQMIQGESPLPEWRTLVETLGQRVQARWGEDYYHGLAEGLDELGNLQLRLDDGQLITLTAGDVTLQGTPQGTPASVITSD